MHHHPSATVVYSWVCQVNFTPKPEHCRLGVGGQAVMGCLSLWMVGQCVLAPPFPAPMLTRRPVLSVLTPTSSATSHFLPPDHHHHPYSGSCFAILIENGASIFTTETLSVSCSSLLFPFLYRIPITTAYLIG